MKKYSLWKKIVVGISAATLIAGGALTACSNSKNQEVLKSTESTQKNEAGSNAKASDGTSLVYMTKDISPKGLNAVYEALGRKATGKVAVKLSTGEPGGNYYLSPDLIKDLVQSVNGTIVECNTAYGGGRTSTMMHK